MSILATAQGVGGRIGQPSLAGNNIFNGNNIFSNGIVIGKALRDCRIDGIVLDGGNASPTNNLTAINNCLANAYANQQDAFFACGQIFYTGTVNDTNMPGLNITGCQANQGFGTAISSSNFGTVQTQFIANVPAGSGIAWDATGSGFQYWRDFSICSAPNVGCQGSATIANPAKVGVLWARDNVSTNGSSSGTGTYCFSSQDVMENVFIILDHNASATARGTVAIANVGAEQFTIARGKYASDTVAFFSGTNDLSLTSPYQTIASGAACANSMTEISIRDGAAFQAWADFAFEFRGAIDVRIDPSTEIINGCASAGGSNCGAVNHNPAFLLDSVASSNMVLGGQTEQFDFPISTSVALDHIYFQITTGSPQAGVMELQTGAAITNSLLAITQRNGSAQPLIKSSSGTATCKGCIIWEGTLSGTGTATNVTVTESTIYAPGISDTNVNTFASGSTYELYDDTGPTAYLGASRWLEIAAPSGLVGSDVCYGDSTAHALECSFNNGAFSPVALNSTFAAPPAIGNTTPAAGSFTTLSANAAAPSASGTAGYGYDATTKTPNFNANAGTTSSFSGAWSCTNVTPVTVSTATNNDQNLMACTIPAGTLNKALRGLRIYAAGVYSTAATSTAQMTLKAKLCTVSGCATGTVLSVCNIQTVALASITVTNNTWTLQCLPITQTSGASAAFERSGTFSIDLGSLTTAADSIFIDPNATATLGTIDSTAQLFLQITAAFSGTTSTSNTYTQRQLVAETVN